MQRNPYWPLNGPLFFRVGEIRSTWFSPAPLYSMSASGPNFAARMASWHYIFVSVVRPF